MQPLGKRKDDFRESFTSTMTSYRRESSGDHALRIAGARFLVVERTRDTRPARAAVFEASDGDRFLMATANDRADAEAVATRFGPEVMVLAVQPQWRFPADAWIEADPVFWKPAASRR